MYDQSPREHLANWVKITAPAVALANERNVSIFCGVVSASDDGKDASRLPGRRMADRFNVPTPK